MAWWGAALSTVTVALNIWKHYRERSALRVKAGVRFYSMEKLKEEAKAEKPGIAVTIADGISHFTLGWMPWQWVDDLPPLEEPGVERFFGRLHATVTNTGSKEVTIEGFEAAIGYSDSPVIQEMFIIPKGFPLTLGPTKVIDVGVSLAERLPTSCTKLCARDTVGKRWCVGQKELSRLAESFNAQATRVKP